MHLTVGQSASRSKTITSDDIKKYSEITGDFNPLHYDEEFAKKTKFGRLVAQGGITTGLLHAIVAMDMPGPGTVFLNQNWNFIAPVFIGDTITARVTIIKLHPTKPVTTISVEITRSHKEVVLEGSAVCYTMLSEIEYANADKN